MKNEKRLNIAYGSNLSLEQMAYRCPTAKIYGRGTLKGYRLLFKGAPENAYATIELYKGGEVPVLVWELRPEDEKALDYYEGFPNFYYKDDLKVELDSGETVTAMVYIMTDKIKDRIHLNLPSQRYLKIVTAGYKSAGFDTCFIEAALKVSEGALKKKPPGII
jgi:cation transport regulator ChaC